ncbi:thiol-disulfide oxidoreductase DCC family protein [Terriglobus albidus]|uniref:thiol-disulfide oxidoreductase DCC family protein n=1 Tax=Terriglobus albidus TaxID=1592106 RepID=UPI0021DFD257|nr:DCC1-like thiol-disulfide oxidoreductase family protein [Terriglobus albidus]
MTAQEQQRLAGRDILLYDGICALCNGVVHFAARRDAAGRLLFLPLGSRLGVELLQRYGIAAEALNSVVVLEHAATQQERIFLRTKAVAQVMMRLRRPWRILGQILMTIPSWLGDPVYRLVARIRYRLTGRYEICPLPEPGLRERFIGLES